MARRATTNRSISPFELPGGLPITSPCLKRSAKRSMPARDAVRFTGSRSSTPLRPPCRTRAGLADVLRSRTGPKNMSRFILNFFSARPCASVREEWVSVRVSRGLLWPASARFSRPVLIWPRASNSLGFGPGATSGGPAWRGPVRGRQKRNGIVMVKKRYSFERRLERRGAGHELRPLSEANWT